MRYLWLLASVLITPMALAKVVLHVPESVDLSVVNMKKAKLEGGLFSSTKTIELENGQNQIVFNYQPTFDSKDKIEKVYGKTLVVKFTAQDTELTFSLPKYRNIREAKKNIDTMTWSLVDKNDQAIAIKQDELKKQGVVLNRNYVEEVNEYNQAGGVAAIGVSYVVPTKELSTSQLSITSQNDSESLQQLKVWYKKANAEDQVTFKKWLVDQK